ncbi:putative nucleic acid-binding protein [Catenuloplanes nepalensis]|uniref:Nucleic acid-binding protein n=1 Tax=Catenuloplanes nepalensis TaxID=587533 RepID=A0ABT9MJK4_9ACTN|nr:type II toxin-antitoxin system VapC family toxin [Catenuloplanes nepalensis]MDP9791606.1 putative nucleic acid-binding protein [Catenuloplanes nepalensis]
MDTNVIILYGGLDQRELPEDIAVSAVTLAELSAGPHHTDDPVERAVRIRRLQDTEAAFEAIPFDTQAARTYGLLVAAVIAAGGKPRGRTADLMIASIAAANRLPLYTTNPADFAGLERLIQIRPVTHPDQR